MLYSLYKSTIGRLSSPIVLCFLLPLFIWGCKKEKNEIVAYNTSVDSLYSLVTYDVNALVSDSGLTQYRLLAQEWYIYDRVAEPYWVFPKGFVLENFGADKSIQARIQADSAIYNQNRQIWELFGRVSVVNQKGEKFFAPSLKWDRSVGGFSCPDTILIITPIRTLHGSNFFANERFTQYSFHHNSGKAIVTEEENVSNENSPSSNSESETDKASLERIKGNRDLLSQD